MTECGGRHLGAARGCRQHRVPPQRTRAPGDGRGRREAAERVGAGQGNGTTQALQRRPCEPPDRPGGAKKAGMPGHASQSPGVLVVHLADEQPTSPRVDLRGDGSVAPGWPWSVSDVTPTLSLSERIELVGERLAPGVFENEPEQDEAEVAVDGPRGEEDYSRGSVQIDRSNSCRPR